MSVEGFLRLIGYGYPTHFFIKETLNGKQVIHENQRFGWGFFPPASARTPRPVLLAAKKPPGTRRIFVFGESAAYGDPVPAFGMPRYLEVLLRDRFRGVDFEVVNVAMTAINSNVILPIARDCAGEEGDFWVLYIGNNEVVGPYGAGTVFGPQAPRLSFIRASLAVKSTRIGQAMDNLSRCVRKGKPPQKSAVGLHVFLENPVRADDPRMERVYKHFARNLGDIIELGTRSKAKVIASTVASNLKDCAPFVSLHRAGLSESERAQWDEFYKSGIKADSAGDPATALHHYEAAARIDDRFAELQFRYAHDLWLSGNFDGARKHYEMARDLDALRVRADSRLNAIVREAATSARHARDVVFVDGNQVVGQISPHGITGQEALFEHVHLNFKGNYHLAHAVAQQIEGLLPKSSAARGDRWLSEEEASQRLGLNDWDRWQTCQVLCSRLSGAPYTAQLNHAEQYAHYKIREAKHRALVDRDGAARCIDSCKLAIGLRPEDWVLHRKFAELLSERGENSSAIAEWKRVGELLPHNAAAPYQTALLLEKAGRTRDALERFRLAVELDPYNADALNAVGRVLAGQGQFPDAIKLCKHSLDLKPELADAMVNIGVAFAGMGNQVEAKSYLEGALGLESDNSRATELLGNLLNRSGEIEATLKRYSEILEHQPEDALTHEKMGELLELLGRFSEARIHYAETVRIKPDFAEAQCRLGLALTREGKLAEATPHLEKAVELDPNSFKARLNLGVAFAKQQKFERGAAQFEEALRLRPNDPNAQKFLLACRAAQARN